MMNQKVLHHSKDMRNNVLRLGMVGSLPPPLGGVTVLFEHLVKSVALMPDVQSELVLIPVGSKSFFCKVSNAFLVARDVMKVLHKVDILTLHIPTLTLPILGPLCFLLARLQKKPFLLRKFGGTNYIDFGWLARLLSTWVVNRSDIYLAEPQALVKVAQDHGAHCAHWYPNNRPYSAVTLDEDVQPRRCRRFVYIGQVRRVKGVLEL